MLSMKFIRENSELVRVACRDKGEPDHISEILRLDERRREIQRTTDTLRYRRNEISKRIGQLIREKSDEAEEAKKEAGELSSEVKRMEKELAEVEQKLNGLLLWVPNIPEQGVPVGSAAQNEIVRVEGEKPTFDFEPRDHLTITGMLNLLDMERAARMTGSFFALFTGAGAKLARSLINFMLDLHTTAHGFTEISPPFVANAESMRATGQIPKLKDDMYRVEQEGFYLVPTAEVVLTNMHRGEMLSESELPIKYCAYTPCFRREAGAYGADTRGLMRLHQFDKVELVVFSHPDTSYEMHEELLGYSEAVLKKLGLHYRVVLLATGDLSFSAAKCYDLEVWAPGEKKWLEVSSCSNFEDFQARRGNIRFRSSSGDVRFVHTLNSSGVALPRLIIAILEQYQTERGTVRVPDGLVPYIGIEEIA